jgi:hypothetical protein
MDIIKWLFYCIICEEVSYAAIETQDWKRDGKNIGNNIWLMSFVYLYGNRTMREMRETDRGSDYNQKTL